MAETALTQLGLFLEAEEERCKQEILKAFSPDETFKISLYWQAVNKFVQNARAAIAVGDKANKNIGGM